MSKKYFKGLLGDDFAKGLAENTNLEMIESLAKDMIVTPDVFEKLVASYSKTDEGEIFSEDMQRQLVEAYRKDSMSGNGGVVENLGGINTFYDDLVDEIEAGGSTQIQRTDGSDFIL